jgi:hypothetical protein
MITQPYIPSSHQDARAALRHALTQPIEQLDTGDFAKAWCSICFLNPGLHPDGYEDADSGWPRRLRPFAAEAWRRFDEAQIGEEVMYPSDATLAGLVALRS